MTRRSETPATTASPWRLAASAFMDFRPVEAVSDLMGLAHPNPAVASPKPASSSVEIRALLRRAWASARGGDFRTAGAAAAAVAHSDPTAFDRATKRLAKRLRKEPFAAMALLDSAPAPRGAAEPSGSPPDRPAHVAYVLNACLPHTTLGYTVRSHAILRSLVGQGCIVSPVTRPGYPLDGACALDGDGPQGRQAPTHHDELVYEHVPGPLRLKTPLYDYLSIAADALTDRLSMLAPTVVAAASDYRTALPAFVAARRLDLPFIYDIRGFWEWTAAVYTPQYADTLRFAATQAVEARLASEADAVFCLTDAMRRDLERRGVPSAHMRLLPNACDPEKIQPTPRDPANLARFGLSGDAPVIGYVGSLSAYEGLDLLIDACLALSRDGIDHQLLVVGDGPERASLETRAQGLGARAAFAGRLPHAEVGAAFNVMDAVVVPRRSSPLTELVAPLKPIEAMAHGKCVVVSSAAATAEAVRDGVTGLVAAKDSVAALTAALTRVAQDSGLREALARAARSWVVEQRSWDGVAKPLAETVATLSETGIADRRLAIADG